MHNFKLRTPSMPPIDANVRQLAPAGSYQSGLFIVVAKGIES